MWIKVLIFILLLALIISLFSGLAFLAKDQGSTKRTLHALGVRLVLAAALMLTIGYGYYSGTLTVSANAPWDARYVQPVTEPK